MALKLSLGVFPIPPLPLSLRMVYSCREVLGVHACGFKEEGRLRQAKKKLSREKLDTTLRELSIYNNVEDVRGKFQAAFSLSRGRDSDFMDYSLPSLGWRRGMILADQDPFSDTAAHLFYEPLLLGKTNEVVFAPSGMNMSAQLGLWNRCSSG